MPTYIWFCDSCKTDTEVERKMADYEVPPDDGCAQCKSKDLKSVIRPKKGVKGFILNGYGWHDQEYTATRSRR